MRRSDTIQEPEGNPTGATRSAPTEEFRVAETAPKTPEPTAEDLIRTYLENARAAIAGTSAEAALEAYARVEPLIPKTVYRSTVRFSTGSNT
jgi:hypothetical protein